MTSPWVITVIYQKNWASSIKDEVQGIMEPTNNLDKYAVTVKGKDGDVIDHIPLDSFYFLKSDKNQHFKISVTGKATMLVTACWWKFNVNYSFSPKKSL